MHVPEVGLWCCYTLCTHRGCVPVKWPLGSFCTHRGLGSSQKAYAMYKKIWQEAPRRTRREPLIEIGKEIPESEIEWWMEDAQKGTNAIKYMAMAKRFWLKSALVTVWEQKTGTDIYHDHDKNTRKAPILRWLENTFVVMMLLRRKISVRNLEMAFMWKQNWTYA